MRPIRPIRRILVPTDFSDSAAEAQQLAVDLAQRFGASITLLHVYQLSVFPLPEAGVYVAPTLSDRLIHDATETLEQLRQALAPSVQATAKLVEGTPHVEILHVAEDNDYDLIVMGTRGRSGIRHLFLGSVAEKVVRGAHCPVMTVRFNPNAQERTPGPGAHETS